MPFYPVLTFQEKICHRNFEKFKFSVHDDRRNIVASFYTDLSNFCIIDADGQKDLLSLEIEEIIVKELYIDISFYNSFDMDGNDILRVTSYPIDFERGIRSWQREFKGNPAASLRQRNAQTSDDDLTSDEVDDN